MPKIIDLALPPEVAFDETRFREHVIQTLRLSNAGPVAVRPLRRSIDARGRQVKVNVTTAVYVNEPLDARLSYSKDLPDVSRAPQAVVVGAGPAGMFAALRLIELGIKPVVLERGKDVRARRRDLAAITKDHVVHPDSNYCFGEGGAGTYSDGKLYTRSNKRGDVRRILEILVAHGATE
ncbi:MAG: FAD-dependent monooxygenase, partial [Cytophagales bacterium]|nr:FAD-dependent monooxygenase [Cytophagales bacterium]